MLLPLVLLFANGADKEWLISDCSLPWQLQTAANCPPFKSSQLSGLIALFEYITYLAYFHRNMSLSVWNEWWGKINKLSQWWCGTDLHAQKGKNKSKQKLNEIFYSAPHWRRTFLEIHWKHFSTSYFVFDGNCKISSLSVSKLTAAVILKLSSNSVLVITPTFHECHKWPLAACVAWSFISHTLPNTQLTFWCLILFDSTLQPMVLSKITAPMLLHSFVFCHYRPVIAVFIVAF